MLEYVRRAGLGRVRKFPLTHCFCWLALEGSNPQLDGYEPSARDALWRELTFLLVVTQIATQAVPDGARTTAN